MSQHLSVLPASRNSLLNPRVPFGWNVCTDNDGRCVHWLTGRDPVGSPSTGLFGSQRFVIERRRPCHIGDVAARGAGNFTRGLADDQASATVRKRRPASALNANEN